MTRSPKRLSDQYRAPIEIDHTNPFVWESVKDMIPFAIFMGALIFIGALLRGGA